MTISELKKQMKDHGKMYAVESAILDTPLLVWYQPILGGIVLGSEYLFRMPPFSKDGIGYVVDTLWDRAEDFVEIIEGDIPPPAYECYLDEMVGSNYKVRVKEELTHDQETLRNMPYKTASMSEGTQEINEFDVALFVARGWATSDLDEKAMFRLTDRGADLLAEYITKKSN